MIWSSNPGRGKILFSKTIQTGSSAHPASYSVGIQVLPSGLSGWDMMSTTHLHLVLRLRISGAIPLLPPIYLHGMDRDNFTLDLMFYIPLVSLIIN